MPNTTQWVVYVIGLQALFFILIFNYSVWVGEQCTIPSFEDDIYNQTWNQSAIQSRRYNINCEEAVPWWLWAVVFTPIVIGLIRASVPFLH